MNNSFTYTFWSEVPTVIPCLCAYSWGDIIEIGFVQGVKSVPHKTHHNMSFLKENRMAGETPTYTYVTYTKNLGMQRKLNQNKINEYVCEVTLGHLTAHV